MDTYVT